jgi:hypothetical protein
MPTTADGKQPADVIVLTFQRHRQRFVDMQV